MVGLHSVSGGEVGINAAQQISRRVGGYKYYDMDQAMAAALELPICEASC